MGKVTICQNQENLFYDFADFYEDDNKYKQLVLFFVWHGNHQLPVMTPYFMNCKSQPPYNIQQSGKLRKILHIDITIFQNKTPML